MQLHRTTVNDANSFRRAPRHEVVATVARDQVGAVLADLLDAGYDSIEVLYDADGLAILDRTGRHHGLRGRLLRGLQELGTEESNIIAYMTALRHGRAVVGALADPGDTDIVGLLARHDADHVVSYGRWSAAEW